jgi:hypothetical protein
MGTPVFKFSEVVEATFLGSDRVRWREISKIYPTDDETGNLIHEYDETVDYYIPVAVMVIEKADATDDVAGAAEIKFTGGFNPGDSLSITVQSAAAPAATPSNVVLLYLSDSAGTAAQLGDNIRKDADEYVWIENQIIAEDGSTILKLWASQPGDTLLVSSPAITRSTVPIPPEMADFIAAVKPLSD